METKSMLAEIDGEIEKLRKARAILTQDRKASAGDRLARPRKRRRLSKEAREKIAAAQRTRWAAERKAKK